LSGCLVVRLPVLSTRIELVEICRSIGVVNVVWLSCYPVVEVS